MPDQTRLFLAPGLALVLGASTDSTPHAHFAAQLSWRLHPDPATPTLPCPPFLARLQQDQAWQETRAALFAPNQEHQIDSRGLPLAHLFVALPGHIKHLGTLGSQLQADFAASAEFTALQQQLSQLWLHGDSADQAWQLVHDCLQLALPTALQPAPVGRDQQRMARAYAAIEAALSERRAINIAELAAQAHLSASRFAHLFRAESGLSLSRYVIWMRLQLALQAVAAGEKLTAAAHGAGFADAAHLSRCFRQVVGIMPSELQKMTIAFKPNPTLVPTMQNKA